MEDSKKKELIEVIKERLKKAEPIPYKEGAWEAYRAKYEPVKTARLPAAFWSAAAALAVAAFASLFFLKEDTSESLVSEKNNPVIAQTSPNTVLQSPQRDDATVQRSLSAPITKNSTSISGFVAPESPADAMLRQHSFLQVSLAKSNASAISSGKGINVGKLDADRTFATGTAHMDLGDVPLEESMLGHEFILAQQSGANVARRQESDMQLSPKKFKVSQKFEFGAFLSPSTTTQSFDVGGGLMLAYQLSDKVAVRTGASFNQYEVGILGSDLARSSMQHDLQQSAPEVGPSGAALVSKEVPYRANNLLLPDLNSVSGKVQTLDIPLEFKYNVGKQFYATGGVSYAVVLSQERFNHITEYTGVPTYSSASDSDQPTNQPAASSVERTLQSSDNNVNTNGFGGFINFSIGRKTKLTKSVKLSIEPYVKMPVGQFKRADMDYTNGGLRVITNF